MHVGELTKSPYVLRARNVHISIDSGKLLLILNSSKMHGEGGYPQKIKITANAKERTGNYRKRNFCPLQLTRDYILQCGGYQDDDEQFFVFADKSPVKPEHTRSLLHTILNDLGLSKESHLFNVHSLRIGKCCDLIKYGYSIEDVKCMGRWRSNCIYKNIR